MMKTVSASELNHLPVGAVYCRLEGVNESPQVGALRMILTTFVSEFDKLSAIERTDDGIIETYKNYSRCGTNYIDDLNAPLQHCWGTRSTGCYAEGDTEKYLVLDNADVSELIRILSNRQAITTKSGGRALYDLYNE